MTAEIVAMNKNAVALAADSAATLDDGIETYNTHNKLFALSKFHPVGIMIYDRLEIQGAPWETIIKMYRKKLGDKSFPEIKGYIDDFLKFLEDNRKLFPKKSQVGFYTQDIFSHLEALRKVIYDEYSELAYRDASADYNQTALKRIDSLIETLENQKDHKCFDDEFKKGIPKLLEFLDQDTLKRLLFPLEIKAEVLKKIQSYVGLLIVKEDFRLGKTGVVISGFGENEHFPCTCDCEIGAFYNNILKRSEVVVTQISNDSSSAILPYAQGDMADAFLKGAHPQYEGFIKNQIINGIIATQYETIQGIDDLSDKQKRKWHSKFDSAPLKRLEDIFESLRGYINSAYIQPTLNGISFLPKDELASAAEALVSLASFKKSVSVGDNTVGGDIDVAIISKGDGLIWVKRKHYFEAEKNPNFFQKYYTIK